MKTILSLSLLLAAVSAQAQQISEEQAAQTARAFFEARGYENTNNGHLAPSHPRTDAPSKLQMAYQRPNAFYIYNKVSRAGEGSFVIVAADERMGASILGWSDRGAFDYDHAPCGLRALLSQYEEAAKDRNGAPSYRPSASQKEVAPMLTTTWNQNTPYNNLCPTVQEANDARRAQLEEAGLPVPSDDWPMEGYGQCCPTGCVITATAQVMNFWQWPKQGSLHHRHSNKYLNMERNFWQSTYDWDNMLDSYSGGYNDAEAQAVASLMADVGCALDASYSGYATAAMTGLAYRILVKHFGYSADIHYYPRGGFTAEDRDRLLRDELDGGRPVLCEINTPQGEHVVVCDGYNADGYLHLNYGWGGVADGFYLPTSMYGEDSEWFGLVTGIRPPEAKEQVDGIWYEALGDKAIVTCPNGANDYAGEANIPEQVTIQGKRRTVSDIFHYAFHETDVTKATIPGTVKKIHEEAFADCSKLRSVIIGDGVQHIGTHAFLGDRQLSNVDNQSRQLLFVGERAFCATAITSFYFRSKGFVIDERAFYQAPVNWVVGLENAAEIRSGNFQHLTGDFTLSPTTTYWPGCIVGDFDHIIIPATVKTFVAGSVSGTRNYVVEEGHALYSSADGVLYNKDQSVLLRVPERDNPWVSIPPMVGRVEQDAITGGLKRLVIPASVSNADFAMSEYNSGQLWSKASTIVCLSPTPPAFTDMGALTLSQEQQDIKLIVPHGSRAAYAAAPVWKDFGSISEDAIYGDGLYYYQVQPGYNFATVMGRNAKASFNGAVNLPEQTTLDGKSYNVTDIDICAFRGDTRISSVKLPATITYLPAGAFRGCTGLTAADLSAAVDEVGERSFEGCRKLATVKFSDRLQSVGSYAFADCPQLRQLSLPATQRLDIYDHAFYASGLQEVSFAGQSVVVWESAFAGNKALKQVTGWESVRQVEGYGFADCALEGDLVFPGAVSLQSYAFQNNPIESVSFGKERIYVTAATFSKCPRLHSFNVAEGNPSNYSQDGMLFAYYDLDWGSGVKTLILCPPMQKVGNHITKRSRIVVPEGTQMVWTDFSKDVTTLIAPASLVQFNYGTLSNCNRLNLVINHATEPQASDANMFHPSVFKDDHPTYLYVPKGCVSKYAAAEGWNKFTYIKEIDPQATAIQQADNRKQAEPKAVYDLQGRRMAADDARRLPKGIYIAGGKKIVMK